MPLFNSRDSAIGDLQGQLQAIIDSTTGSPWLNLSNFQSRPDLIGTGKQLGLSALQNYLMGSQQRDLGIAGRAAGAKASAYNLNPYSAQQHAQSGIYGQYANEFSRLPLNLFNATTAGQGQNFQHLLALLGLKSGLAGQRDDESGGIGGFLGGALSTGAHLLPGWKS